MTLQPKSVDQSHFSAWVQLGLQSALTKPASVMGVVLALLLSRILADAAVASYIAHAAGSAEGASTETLIISSILAGIVCTANALLALVSANVAVNYITSLALRAEGRPGARDWLGWVLFKAQRDDPTWIGMLCIAFTVMNIAITPSMKLAKAMSGDWEWILDLAGESAVHAAFSLGGWAMYSASALAVRQFDYPLSHRAPEVMSDRILLSLRVDALQKNPWLKEKPVVLRHDGVMWAGLLATVMVGYTYPAICLPVIVMFAAFPFVHVAAYLDVFEDGDKAKKLLHAKTEKGRHAYAGAGA